MENKKLEEDLKVCGVCRLIKNKNEYYKDHNRCKICYSKIQRDKYKDKIKNKIKKCKDCNCIKNDETIFKGRRCKDCYKIYAKEYFKKYRNRDKHMTIKKNTFKCKNCEKEFPLEDKYFSYRRCKTCKY